MNRDDVPSTDDVRDIWVDYHLNPLPRTEGIALVPEYQEAFDAWLETIRADERERITHNVTAEWAEAVHDYRADLRAKVEALPGWGTTEYIFRADVLALLPGASDE